MKIYKKIHGPKGCDFLREHVDKNRKRGNDIYVNAVVRYVPCLAGRLVSPQWKSFIFNLRKITKTYICRENMLTE